DPWAACESVLHRNLLISFGQRQFRQHDEASCTMKSRRPSPGRGAIPMERVKIKTTSWWLLAFGYLAMLTGFGLTALHDYKGLRASEHKTPAPLASTTDATTVSDFEIKEWPRRLRTDLKGTS